MREFLVRLSASKQWPPVHRTKMEQVLLPRGLGFEALPATPGSGDFLMGRAEVEVSFAGEEPGWQVNVFGSITDEDVAAILKQVTRQIEAEAGEPCEWLEV